MFLIVNKLELIFNLVVNSDLFICDILVVVSECIFLLFLIFIYIFEDCNVIIFGSDMYYFDYVYIFLNIE